METATSLLEGIAATSSRRRRGFNLIELMVVLAIVSILTSLMMPGLSAARHSALRIVCASNLRHIGAGLHAYTADHSERLPASKYFGNVDYQPQEMMAASAGADASGRTRWDGLGCLVDPRRPYLDSPESLHCPCHCGQHEYERYADAYRSWTFVSDIYTNYHFRGAFDRDSRRYTTLNGNRRLLVVDGMRTRQDFNHGHGTNRLHSDTSVDWFVDTSYAIAKSLPHHQTLAPEVQAELYDWIWDRLERD